MLKDRKYPTLYVKNFAKIKEAEIELAPFTLFIGDNNSGKSYLASLIWYIQSSNLLIFDMYRQYKNEYKEYKFLNDLCNKIINNEKFEIKIDNNIIDECIESFNIMLKNRKNKILEELFNFKDIKIDKLMVYKADIDYNIKINSNILENESKKNKLFNIKFKYSYGSRQIISEIRGNDIKKRIFFTLFEVIIDIILFSTRYFNKLFLPVARTGFLLLKDIVMDKAFDTLFNDKLEKKENIKLTKPLENFIRKLSMLRSEDEKNNNIINFIENDIIKGKIYLDNMPSPQVHYKSNNSDMDFQMHVSSAVITELAPLILFLKYDNYKDIIMEEPEISLHPYLQQQLTRAFIKLVNSGKNILITTHSDTIVQHINNMIKLNANEKKRQKKLMEKYKYDEDDIISEDKIRMYQFDAKEDGTEVKALESSKYGFEAPTFNEILIKISKEIQEFQEELD